MSEPVEEMKRRIRSEIRGKLSGLTPESRQRASAAACDLLRRQKVWRDAQTVLLYAPLPDEVDLWPALLEAFREGRQVALPRYINEQEHYGAFLISDAEALSVRGRYGIIEPGVDSERISLKRLDFALVPGLAFSPDGARLGRGRGFYDRLLSEMSGWKCGVAFDEQVCRDLPVEPHDVKMDLLLTPGQWWETGSPDTKWIGRS